MSILTTMNQVSNYLFLTFIVGIPAFAAYKRVKVFDTFVVGAAQGLQTIIKIFPYLLAMLVAIGMLRASGFFELLGQWLAPLLSKWGVPVDVLPVMLVRPFSGSAATGLTAELIHQHGGNAYTSYLAATVMGGTETTFYVVAVYMGSVNITRTRHAIPAGLCADLAGMIGAIFICRYLFLS